MDSAVCGKGSNLLTGFNYNLINSGLPQSTEARTPCTMALSLFLHAMALWLLVSVAGAPGMSSDMEALLAFKAQVTDPLGVLRGNWTANTSLCSWVGVSCGRRHPERAVVLALPGMHHLPRGWEPLLPCPCQPQRRRPHCPRPG